MEIETFQLPQKAFTNGSVIKPNVVPAYSSFNMQRPTQNILYPYQAFFLNIDFFKIGTSSCFT